MNRKEFSSAVAKKADVTQVVANKVVGASIETIKETLAKGEKIEIIGFGIFEAKLREARTGRNPQTGAAIKIPATVAPTFRAGKAFKDYLKENAKKLLKK